MSKRGRPRKPSAKLKLAGTYRPDRRYSDEPKPEVKVPKIPTFLKREARREWKRVTPLLSEQRLITELDRPLIAAYCYEWGAYVELCNKLKDIDDYVTLTMKGNQISSPLLNARNRALKNMKELATEFGFSPVSRTRISTGQAERANPFMELLKRNA